MTDQLLSGRGRMPVEPQENGPSIDAESREQIAHSWGYESSCEEHHVDAKCLDIGFVCFEICHNLGVSRSRR